MRLNIGCGSLPFAGFINCDAVSEVNGVKLPVDVVCDALHLPFEDNSADWILGSHVYEHFDENEQKELLIEWHRVLKPNAWVEIECPELESLCRKYLAAPEWQRRGLEIQFFGNWTIPGHGHKRVPTTLELVNSLCEAGFVEVIEAPAYRYSDLCDSCVKVLGRKG